MIHSAISRYLARTEAKIVRRTIPDWEFYAVAIPSCVLAGIGIAAFSFVVNIPGLS